MNVTCPNCATVFRVDPAKVPEAGVRARCSVCGAVFGVQREGNRPPQPAAVQNAPLAAPSAGAGAPAAVPPAPAVAAPAARPAPTPARRPAPPAAAPAPLPGRSPPAGTVPAGRARRVRRARAPLPAAAGGPAMAASGRPAAPPAAPAAPPPRHRCRPTPPRPRPGRRPVAGRPVNPFLSQDPAQKARRLARALVSDIVVYHPAKRQEGLRDGTLKELFEDEIRKSYEEYTEQVGRDLAESTGYFREALNEILAGGRQLF